jgi:MATE family multidrug resistance protein
MVLAFFSGNVMLFVDRLFLANFSIDAMNAAVASGMVAIVFQYGAATITSISVVFVGQLNGAKEYLKVGGPAWQMLWFSAIMQILFFSIGLWGGPYLLPEYHYAEFGLPYFQWMFYFGAAAPAIAALTGFFIGIGKTKYVMIISVIGNCVNILFDIILIFGIKGILDPMGTKGAAIGTGISLMVQLLLFGAIFLSRKYRNKYGTGTWKFDFPLFIYITKIGVPSALGHMIEWGAWAISLRLMAEAGELYLTVATVGLSIYMLVIFGFEGVQKAVTTIASNCIGALKSEGIFKTWSSGIKLLMLSAIPLGVILVGYPQPIISEFLSKETSQTDLILLTSMLRYTLIGVFIYYLLDGFTWISVGVLTANEDTWFVMWVNAVTASLCALAPVFIFMVYLQISPVWYFFLISIYGLCNALAFYLRLKTTIWNHK